MPEFVSSIEGVVASGAGLSAPVEELVLIAEATEVATAEPVSAVGGFVLPPADSMLPSEDPRVSLGVPKLLNGETVPSVEAALPLDEPAVPLEMPTDDSAVTVEEPVLPLEDPALPTIASPVEGTAGLRRWRDDVSTTRIPAVVLARTARRIITAANAVVNRM
jgi:hypothetical protein